MLPSNSTPRSNSKQIDYIVARKWDEKKPACGNLAIYMGCSSEIHHGTLEEARLFLEYVRKIKPDDQWDLYKIKYEKLTVV